MHFFKKKLQLLYKLIIYQIFKIIYGTIFYSNNIDSDIKINDINKDNNNYKFVEINNGRIYTDYVENVAIINKNQIINHVSYQQIKGEFKDPSFNVVLKNGTPKFKKKYQGTVFSLAQGASGNNNYFHWMFDILPRLILLEKFYKLDDINYFYSPDIKQWQLSTLSIFNIKKNKLINSKKYKHITADKILAISHPWYHKGYILDEAKYLPSWIMNDIYLKFYKHAEEFDCNDKIFIDRRESKFSHCQIINDEEIKDYLTKKGFSVYKISQLSFFEQIYLFQNAKIIIGAHGAAFTNLIFCKPKTKVIDIIPEDHPNTVDKTIGNFKNLNFNFIKTKKLSDNQKNDGDIFLSLNEIQKFI
tara:strand:- start:766 stop:1842 length:1077 start_codon:yes stop_codon:yes gene_type:complete